MLLKIVDNSPDQLLSTLIQLDTANNQAVTGKVGLFVCAMKREHNANKNWK